MIRAFIYLDNQHSTQLTNSHLCWMVKETISNEGCSCTISGFCSWRAKYFCQKGNPLERTCWLRRWNLFLCSAKMSLCCSVEVLCRKVPLLCRKKNPDQSLWSFLMPRRRENGNVKTFHRNYFSKIRSNATPKIQKKWVYQKVLATVSEYEKVFPRLRKH